MVKQRSTDEAHIAKLEGRAASRSFGRQAAASQADDDVSGWEGVATGGLAADHITRLLGRRNGYPIIDVQERQNGGEGVELSGDKQQ